MVVPAEVAVRRLEARRAELVAKLKGELTERTRRYARQVELPLVDEALRRAREGTYGDCVECGESIDTRRLEAIPEVPLCKSCEDASLRTATVRERRA